jgi:hypothetical protein
MSGTGDVHDADMIVQTWLRLQEKSEWSPVEDGPSNRIREVNNDQIAQSLGAVPMIRS